MTDTLPIVLVDGSSYLYRAYHALPALTNSKGVPTGAVKGVVNMVRRLLKDYPQSPVAVIFDAKGKTFRDDLYEDYKANRPPMPDDLREQVAPIHQIIEAMGLPLVVIEGVEADDVIGTLAAEATRKKRPLVVSTGDKDMAQLVNEYVTLVNTMTDTVLDVAGVKEKFELPPERIIDFLALMGDKVDNIPGVPGVGEKTAKGLIQALGGIDDIYQQLDAVATVPVRGAKSLGQKLEVHEAEARLSYQLATIKTDVALEFGLDEIALGEAQEATLLELFKDLEFKTWVKTLETHTGPISEGGNVDHAPAEVDANAQAQAQEVPPTAALAVNYQTVLTEAELEAWLAKLAVAPLFAFDTETTALNYMEARVVGVSFAVMPGEAAYVPFGHDYLGAPTQLSEQQVLGALKPLLEDASVKKVGQNLKYDAHVLRNHQIVLRGIAHDTMLASYVLNSIARHDMDSLALEHLDHETIHFADIAGKGAKQLTFNQIALEKAAPYAAEDADVTLRLHHALSESMAAVPEIVPVYEEIELPLIPILVTIEQNGALLDANALAEQSQQLGEQLTALERQAYDIAGREFNLSSPKQLAQILFEEQNIPVKKKTAKGAPSTAEEVLQDLAHEHELPRVLIEHRGLAKLKSTYTDKLPRMIHPATGRVHTSYHQAVAATGRLSSTEPNLQNIPIRTEAGRRIRKAFVAPQGYKLLAADYSQIELRIMAHLSEDPGLLAAFGQGQDVHKATAAEVYGVAVDEVTNEQRRNAKAINFGLIYGMSAFGLARQLHISRSDAAAAIDKYFEQYPGVKLYMDTTRAQAAKQGYVETLCGRRLYLPNINDRNPMRRQAAERTAINAPMQGSAADIIKKAMIAVDAWLQASEVDAKMIMQVHDELVLEVKEADIPAVIDKVKTLMGQALALKVPLEVDVGVGNNWDEAH